MTARRQYFQDRARDFPFAFHRLIGVGVGADGDAVALVAWPGNFRLQQLCCVGLGKQACLEIQPRRQIQVRMRRACVAIDATVFATAIGVDRLSERDVRRVIAGNDTLGPLRGDDGPGTARFLLRRRVPAVFESLARILLETPFGIEGGAAALVGLAMITGYGLHSHTGHLTSITPTWEEPRKGPSYRVRGSSGAATRPWYPITIPSSSLPSCTAPFRDWRTRRGC